MRPIKFKKWIPRKMETIDRLQIPVKGTGCFEEDFTHDGYFHCWGINHEENECGFGNYTTAIVELPDGTVEEMMPVALKFNSPTK